MRPLSIENKTILITGANRGIGRALVDEAIRRGARRVYAGIRSGPQHADKRVTSLTLDVTDALQIQHAAGKVDALDLLVNNAGVAIFDDLSDPSMIERHLAVNLFGALNLTRALLPHLTRSKGAVVNTMSVAAFAAMPVLPAYSISKSALLSWTQALRAQLAGRGIAVHGVFPGPVDTDMARGLDIPKASAESVARATLDGVERGEEDIFPDPMSASMAESWRGGAAKALERQFAAFVA